jgi:alpha-glucoside transport system substrate-binding protein
MTRTIALSLLMPMVLASLFLQACAVSASNGKGSVTVLAPWTGSEEEQFRKVLDAFTDETGISVSYQGTRALGQVLLSDVQQGTQPDVAILGSPAELVRYVRTNQVRALDNVIARQRDAYDPQWLLPQNGKIYAVPVKVNLKSLIWYDPARFPTRPNPQTWAELVELSRTVAARGGVPWCLGMSDAPSSGWPGTDMIEGILLYRSGPKVFSSWSTGGLPWTTPEVKEAWKMWGQITASSRTGPGGARALLTDFGDAGRPMFADPPGCFLEQQASFIMGIYQGYRGSNGKSPLPGTDFDFFPVPAFGGPTDDPASREWEVSADLAGMFKDTPQAHRLIQFLATVEAQRIWPAVPGASAFTANRNVDPNVYQDDVSRRISRIIRTAGALCFDASDVMPPAVRNAFDQAVLEYLNDPSQLDGLLKRLETLSGSLNYAEWLYRPCGQ